MKKIFTILLLSAGLLMSGCSDWLDVLPKDKQSTDMYWESSEDVEAILAQGYSRLRTCVPIGKMVSYNIRWIKFTPQNAPAVRRGRKGRDIA